MRARRGNPAAQMQKHRSGMFVCRNRRPERDVAQVLERVTQRVVARVAITPQAVALGEFFGSESRETQHLVQIDKTETGLAKPIPLLPVRFVPLVHGRAGLAARGKGPPAAASEDE